MANLLIDIGNTSLKAAWADGITLGKTFRYQGEKMLDFISGLIEKSRPDIMVLSSVRYFSPQNIDRLRSKCGKLVILNNEIYSDYSVPSYVSPDRLASIIACRYLFKGKSCSIFDFGSTLSVDFLDKDGNYSGGNVSLGCQMRFKALNRYSKNLPLVNICDEIMEIGDNQEDSIKSGVIEGIIFEINGYLDRYAENMAVFTGGDAIYFAKRMKNSIFVVCNIVLMGLALVALRYE